MPLSPFSRACSIAGCPQPPGPRGLCAAHRATLDGLRGLGSDRFLGAALYRSERWRVLRLAVLARYPCCQCDACLSSARPLAADAVHHVVPHRGDPRAFFDEAKLIAVNEACHNRITRQARGGGR